MALDYHGSMAAVIKDHNATVSSHSFGARLLPSMISLRFSHFHF